MIEKLEITAVHTDLTPELKKYVTRKIGKLDTYLPKHARESAHAEVFLKEAKLKTRKQYTCEVVVSLPHDRLTVQESTMNMFAAVDIVEAKLRNQFKKYKETHSSLKIHRRVISRLRRTEPAPEPEV
jgi:ribosomal subunit interface protein